jgi:cell division protein FtsL
LFYICFAVAIFVCSGEISSLSATRLQLETTVSDLSTQLKQVKDKVASLEGQKTSLESQSESQTKDLLKKGASLEQVLLIILIT